MIRSVSRMLAAQLSAAWVAWTSFIAAQVAAEEGQAGALRTMTRCIGRMRRAQSGVAFRTWYDLTKEDAQREEDERRLLVGTVKKMLAAQVRVCVVRVNCFRLAETNSLKQDGLCVLAFVTLLLPPLPSSSEGGTPG